MRALLGVSVLAASLTACTPVPLSQRPPYLPIGVFGTYEDNDIGAINFSAWAFASPANTRGNPLEAARAVVALEYLPSELLQNPRWVSIDSAIILHMGRSRTELRHILGIRPEVPSQVVVNTMLAFAADLQTGNVAAAMQVLEAPIFTNPPEQTYKLLSGLPYIQEANLATSRAEDQSFPVGGNLR